MVVAEDHFPEEGLGRAVLEALASASVAELRVAHLAVQWLLTSGKPAVLLELLEAAGISSRHIVAAERQLRSG